ncbi:MULTISPECIES: fatty acid--CoA ligase [Caulobacter]|jgi:acyl-CoA synthetase (AMP-forming)/AMP-acid ligase II|uniref:3-methylmercaptopropionyl-CoA ligase n=1 Tax=Caulobacter vibrioides OR37 TaxID=1292034 RepID=R0E7L6_CAUVI|nr:MULTISPECIES: fatty acid--CoA ligase [Caulobacter]ENZ78119.1 acyl-CoA synthetase (AMP-forming)/AMP-acid ligase II [Caulobacter vibrioides OR37]MBQ1562009.1 fatty acid--CoA ligase [Caulobacter sp.]
MADAIDFDRMRTLGDVARYHAEARPDAVALVFEGRETSFADFDRHTNQVANALIAAGLKVGDRVAYVGKNSDHYFELLIGAAKAGVVTTPIGWRLAAPEIAYIVGDSEAKLVFVGPELIGHVEAVAAELTHRPVVIAMEAEGAGEHRTFEAWRDAQPDTDPMTPIKTSDIAIQLYTSGTTGRPKGAMLTHDNMLAMRREAALRPLDWNQWGPDDVSLVAMPVAHIGGTGWGLVGLFNGAKGVVAREFDPTKVLDFIEKDRVSKMFMVPAALQIVVRLPRAREVDYSRLSHILYGAAPIPLDLLRECMEVFGCGFVQQYGMTETTGTVVYLPPEDHDPAGNTRMRAAGLPMPGVEIKVIDEAGNSVPAGTVGEVAIRSLANMAGYWKLDEATKKTIDADGWLRTGDAGYLDEDGYLFIHDRVKDMIISGGENIYPAEVESAVYGHPHVAEVAVIGVPDDKWGEAVKAVVAPKPGVTPDAADIIAFARSRIAGFKAPKSVDFVPALPRNASGKILRRELRAPYWEGRERQVN